MDCRRIPPPHREHPICHDTPRGLDPEDHQGQLGAQVLKELLAVPPAVLNAPVFRKVQRNLEAYRKLYTRR